MSTVQGVNPSFMGHIQIADLKFSQIKLDFDFHGDREIMTNSTSYGTWGQNGTENGNYTQRPLQWPLGPFRKLPYGGQQIQGICKNINETWSLAIFGPQIGFGAKVPQLFCRCFGVVSIYHTTSVSSLIGGQLCHDLMTHDKTQNPKQPRCTSYNIYIYIYRIVRLHLDVLSDVSRVVLQIS